MSQNPSSASLAFGPNPQRWPVFRPLNPSAAGTLIALNKPICVVGARALVHMHLNSPQVSRSHALILHEAGRVYVRDLASKNGTYRNGDLIREAELYAADMVRFGPFILNCQENFPPAPLAAGDDADPDEAASPMVGELELDASGRRIDLSPRTVLIGRRSGCDVVLTEREISRAHAVVFRHEKRQLLRDLNSKNGTYVNGEKVRQVELKEGDQIQIGPHTLMYSLRPRGEAAAAAAAAVELTDAELMSGSHLSLADPITGAPGGAEAAQVGSTTHSGTLLALNGPATADVADALSASQAETKEWTGIGGGVGGESGGLDAGASPSWMGGSAAELPAVEATPEELLATRDRLPVVADGDGAAAAAAGEDLPWLLGEGEFAKPADVFGEGSSAGLAQPAEGGGGARNDGGPSAVSMSYDLAPWPAPADGVAAPASAAAAESLEADAAELFAETPVFDELAPPAKPADGDLLMLSEHDLSPEHSGRDQGARKSKPAGTAAPAERSVRRGTWRDLTAPTAPPRPQG